MAEPSPQERVMAEQIAMECLYQFRQHIIGASPNLKLIAAKSLLSKVRTMVDDLEDSI